MRRFQRLDKIISIALRIGIAAFMIFGFVTFYRQNKVISIQHEAAVVQREMAYMAFGQAKEIIERQNNTIDEMCKKPELKVPNLTPDMLQ